MKIYKHMGTYAIIDDYTAQYLGLEPEFEITEEELNQNGGTFHTDKNGNFQWGLESKISAEREIASIESWFSEIYSYQEQKYRRLAALNKPDDDGVSADIKLAQLYAEAEQKRARIQELEQIIEENS